MLDKIAVKDEYAAWRTGTDLNNEIAEMPTFDEIDRKSPAERRWFYDNLRNKALRFALVIRLAIGDSMLDDAALSDVQYGMLELRKWYYAMSHKIH